MSITLRDVTQEMFDRVIALKVKEEQKDLIHDTRYFLNLSSIEQDLRPLSIYYHDDLVGFCTYSTDDEDGRVWIQSLMIDAAHQGKGYSVKALTALVELIRKERNPPAVFTSIGEKNTAAKAIFQKLNFTRSDEREGEADVWVLKLS